MKNVYKDKRRENPVAGSEKGYYESLFNSIDSGFCVIEVIFDGGSKPVDYRFLLVNPAFEQQTGLKNVAGKRVRDMVPELEQYWFDIYGRIALTGRPARFENHSAAMRRWYDVYAFRLGEPGNHHVAILFDDITARKDAENGLKESNAKLARANKLLEDSNRRLDDFVYIVSHDLKEPVRGIKNFSAFLTEDYSDRLDAQGREYLNTLQSIADRMNELILDLLKYATISRAEIQMEMVDLRALIGNILELMQLQLEKDNVSVTVDPALPSLYCSKAHLAEIFRNLIVNGIKYNKSNPKKIEIGVMKGHPKDPGDRYVFYVKDNGIGIPEGEREAIFGMFKRLHGRDQYGGGTGSGLAIVKNLVEQHNGEIWVEDNPGGGAVFYFYTDCV